VLNFKEFCLLGCNALQSTESQQTYWKNISKQETSVKNVAMLHAGFLLGLIFDPEDGGDIFLQNIHSLSTVYTALYSRR
jgi:hypothetical protein